MPRKIWFPAKRFGWGWGLPIHWKGWVVLLVFMGALIHTSIKFNPATHPETFFVRTAAIALGLILICWLKGEKPRWRWGGD